MKALRRAVLPEECVLTNLSGEGWRGAVCGHEQAVILSPVACLRRPAGPPGNGKPM